MCKKVLEYFTTHSYLKFIYKISKFQQALFNIFGFILIIVSVENFSFIYHSDGVIKLLIYLIIILFLFGGFLNMIKTFIDANEWFRFKYYLVSFCLYLIGLIIGIFYFIFKVIFSLVTMF